ncbi:SDR family NAD(P)-dependent oxidoreductase [Pseudoflavitalea sp. G-6-1-2]|uniref:SDR family NAD(P)-dependent oxidoreductase n=1 Tax=Pseudoflavitalea sp. G-6-1-2 TaxID=2728841 RepID=UPI00146CD342|nr:SDR family NAD(P)-dependent oxidoreductase [Pseudoflavitalea sp. G-6-1-2]NML22501.1 SDR family NAD(P)-dependent oxidoreductase [Pseudoflavitalea sp. G-6-1-2]
MKHALITGANKSIGLETARQLLQLGYFVYLGSRSVENGLEAAAQLRAEGYSNTEVIQLDVTDETSVKAAREILGQKTEVLDGLINNAGMSGGFPQSATNVNIETVKTVFETNLFGVIRVTQAFVDLMRNAPAPRIVNVSSAMGSLTLHSDPAFAYYDLKGAAYLPSKSALNMYTITLAYDLRDTAFKVNTVDPGFTKTDFNNHRGTGTVEDAAARVVKYAIVDENGPTGKFFSEEYNPVTGEIPW